MKKLFLSAVSCFVILAAKAQWIPQNAGFVRDTLGFYEMSYGNENSVWAVCFDIKFSVNRGRFIQDFTRTTDGGVTWTPGKINADPSLQFANVSAISKDEAWVAMNRRFLTGGGLYHTTDGGLTWQQKGVGQIYDENSYPNVVHFKNKNKGITMGDPNNGYFEIHTTQDAGNTWTRIPSSNIPAPLPNEYGWLSGYAALDNTIWFGTLSGRMYKSNDFGKNWTVHNVDLNRAVFEIAFSDDKMHGVSHLRDNFGTYLYTTSDGGITWVNRGQPAGWKSSRITAVPGTSAFVATSVSFFDRGSSVSYDYGDTWNIIENAVPKTVTRFFNQYTGFTGAPFVYGPPLRGGIWKSELDFSAAALRKGNQNDQFTEGLAQKPVLTRADQVQVYPSPAKDLVNIVLEEAMVDTKTFVSLLNPQGQVVESKKSLGVKQLQFNVSNLTPGLYVVKIVSNGQVVSKAVTVIR